MFSFVPKKYRDDNNGLWGMCTRERSRKWEQEQEQRESNHTFLNPCLCNFDFQNYGVGSYPQEVNKKLKPTTICGQYKIK